MIPPVLTHAPSQTSFAMERITPLANTTTLRHTLSLTTSPPLPPLSSSASVTRRPINRSHSNSITNSITSSTSTNPRRPPSSRRRSRPSSRRSARPRARCRPTRVSRTTSCSIRWASESSFPAFCLPISSARAVEARHGRALRLHRVTQLAGCCPHTLPGPATSSGGQRLLCAPHFRAALPAHYSRPPPPMRSRPWPSRLWHSCLPKVPAGAVSEGSGPVWS